MQLLQLARTIFEEGRGAVERARARTQPRRPVRTPGVELIGEYRDSGFREPPYLVRRPDGQVVQLSRLLYVVLEHADGEHDAAEIARVASRRFGRALSADNVSFLLETKLRPAGLIGGRDERTPAEGPRRADPLLALRHRFAVVPAGAVRFASRAVRPLFMPAVVGAALSWLAVLDVWVFAEHGLGEATQQMVRQPLLLLGLLALVVISAVWHELGHAGACSYGGATPGAMGVGLYVVWPAFYTDVTDAYRLGRAGRLRTDLGGVYFNALFALAAGGAYFATRFEPLLALVAVQHFQILQQLMPLMRLDGYYVVTDLAGVPDVLSRIKPLLMSLLPFRKPDARVLELKPWVRVVATTYVVGFVLALGAVMTLLAIHAPRYVPRAVESITLYSQRASLAYHAHQWTAFALSLIQVGTLMLPLLGMAFGVARLAGKLMSPLTRRVPARPRMGGAVAFAAGVALAWVFFGSGLGGSGQQAGGRQAAVETRGHLGTAAKRATRQIAHVARRRLLLAAQRQAAATTATSATAPSPAPAPPPAPAHASRAPAPAPGTTTSTSTSPDRTAPTTTDSTTSTTDTTGTTGTTQSTTDPGATTAP